VLYVHGNEYQKKQLNVIQSFEKQLKSHGYSYLNKQMNERLFDNLVLFLNHYLQGHHLIGKLLKASQNHLLEV